MRVGWVIPTLGCFGAVREVVEVSNVLVGRGHKVTLFHPDGGPCTWLESHSDTALIDQARTAELDVLIGVIDWKWGLYDVLRASPAPVKAMCLLGFDPTEEMAARLRGDQPLGDRDDLRVMRDALDNGVRMLVDGSWQIDWFRDRVGDRIGPAFGGINLQMFRPGQRAEGAPLRVIASGDPRGRKGSDTVMAAMRTVLSEEPGVEFETYWGKGFDQAGLVSFYQDADIFVDGHRRAGWCNPVAEAMACATAVVCTDIGAVSDFAVNGETAIVVPVDDSYAMAAGVLALIRDGRLRLELVANGLRMIRLFDYERVVPKLERRLEAWLLEAGRVPS